MEYVQHVRQVRDLTSNYWFDLLIALLAIVAMLEVVLGRGTPGAPTTTLWFCVPAIAVLVLPVFARRRFPFAGPANGNQRRANIGTTRTASAGTQNHSVVVGAPGEPRPSTTSSMATIASSAINRSNQ